MGLDADLVGHLNRALVDLTLPIRPGMFPIAEASNVKLTVLHDHDSSPMGMFETQLRMSCHAGTHIDYASHIDPDGPRAFAEDGFRDSLFPEATLTTAYLMAFDDKQGTDRLPNEMFRFGDQITRDEIEGWFQRFDGAHPGFDHAGVKGAILRTGWNDRYFEPDFFKRGSPTLSDDATRALMERGLDYIGADFLFSAHPGGTHDIVMRGTRRFQVEGLCNLSSLDGPLIGLLISPLKIVGAEGLPARVYAFDLAASNRT